MRVNVRRKPGFYWVRFEGEVIVAEYTDGRDCIDTSTRTGLAEYPHWHVPGSDGCLLDG